MKNYMKKNILGFAGFMMMVALAPSVASAQWTTSGLNIYNSNTGNVGIGTTNPVAPLNIKVTPSLTFVRIDPASVGGLSGLQMSDGNNPVAEFSANTGSGQVKFGIISTNAAYYLSLLSANTERMRITYGGDIGIGTTTPAAKLDVNGTANISGNLKIGSNITSDGDICIGVCP